MVDKINFAGVKSEFEPVDDATYEVEFKDYKLGETSGQGKLPAGTPKADLQFAITEEGPAQNRRVFKTCVFHPDSLWVFKRTMGALGADVDWEDPEGVDVEAVMRSVLGNKGLAEVGHREYEQDGVTKVANTVGDIKPLRLTDEVETVGRRGRR